MLSIDSYLKSKWVILLSDPSGSVMSEFESSASQSAASQSVCSESLQKIKEETR